MQARRVRESLSLISLTWLAARCASFASRRAICRRRVGKCPPTCSERSPELFPRDRTAALRCSGWLPTASFRLPRVWKKQSERHNKQFIWWYKSIVKIYACIIAHSFSVVVNSIKASSRNFAFLWLKAGRSLSNRFWGDMHPFSMIFRSTNCAFSLVASLLSPTTSKNLWHQFSRTGWKSKCKRHGGRDIVEPHIYMYVCQVCAKLMPDINFGTAESDRWTGSGQIWYTSLS